jgi:hypothetical protein
MNLQGYEVLADAAFEKYEFISVGVKGPIRKIVLFKQMGFHIYNLSFGDWDESTGELNDTVRTNNGDRSKVLTTVAITIVDFLKNHPDCTVFAIGSTPSKSRLYQMELNAYWHTISMLYYIEGYINNNWEEFKPGKNYEAFTVRSR